VRRGAQFGQWRSVMAWPCTVGPVVALRRWRWLRDKACGGGRVRRDGDELGSSHDHAQRWVREAAGCSTTGACSAHGHGEQRKRETENEGGE
jgi:hypothetical protein